MSDLACWTANHVTGTLLVLSALTLHGGSSPKGSQASRLMLCLFQGRCFTPEGGGPA
jgi:hypothetical protein